MINIQYSTPLFQITVSTAAATQEMEFFAYTGG